jgi:hypothetical protein
VKDRLVLLWLAIAVPSDFALAAEQSIVEYHLIPIAGESAARCGIFRRPPGSMPGLVELSREESRAVSQCITAAHRQRRGFLFSVEAPGADVSLAGGLVGDRLGPSGNFTTELPAGRVATTNLALVPSAMSGSRRHGALCLATIASGTLVGRSATGARARGRDRAFFRCG